MPTRTELGPPRWVADTARAGGVWKAPAIDAQQPPFAPREVPLALSRNPAIRRLPWSGLLGRVMTPEDPRMARWSPVDAMTLAAGRIFLSCCSQTSPDEIRFASAVGPGTPMPAETAAARSDDRDLGRLGSRSTRRAGLIEVGEHATRLESLNGR